MALDLSSSNFFPRASVCGETGAEFCKCDEIARTPLSRSSQQMNHSVPVLHIVKLGGRAQSIVDIGGRGACLRH